MFILITENLEYIRPNSSDAILKHTGKSDDTRRSNLLKIMR